MTTALRESFSDSMNIIFKNSHLTLSEFADELSISRSSLQDILKGRSNPTLQTIEFIAAHLGTEPLNLLSRSDDQMAFLFYFTLFTERAGLLSEEEWQKALAAAGTLYHLFSEKKG